MLRRFLGFPQNLFEILFVEFCTRPIPPCDCLVAFVQLDASHRVVLSNILHLWQHL